MINLITYCLYYVALTMMEIQEYLSPAVEFGFGVEG